MRDHVLKWPELADWSRAEINAGGLIARPVRVGDQLVASGDLGAFGRDTGLDPEGVGALGLATGPVYTVRLARDRLMAVGAPPGAVAAGWNSAGYAVTAMSAALQVFELSGAGALALIRRATTLDPAAPGRCAVVSFAGINVSLYRHGQADTFRLHVDRGLAAYLWAWLGEAVAAMG